MNNRLIARVAIENVAYDFDQLYDYIVPDFIETEVLTGRMTAVPFGAGDKPRTGMIFELYTGLPPKGAKSLLSLPDGFFPLSDEQLRLAKFLKDRTFCTYYEAVKIMLPPGVGKKLVSYYELAPEYRDSIPDGLSFEEADVVRETKNSGFKLAGETLLQQSAALKLVISSLVEKGIFIRHETIEGKMNSKSTTVLRLSTDSERLERFCEAATIKQLSVVDFLRGHGDASQQEIAYYTGVSSSVISTLKKKEILEEYRAELYRIPFSDLAQEAPEPENIILTDEQQTAFSGLSGMLNKGFEISLLYGITGSGKTKVYLKLIDEALKKKVGVIVMVPEIALTPQTLSIFRKRYGKRVALIHSGLSNGERYDEYRRVREGEADIVVGTRSAVFSPVIGLGLIIIDEEHEQSYKSEKNPRYHARTIAAYRCKLHDALLVLASATPSVESFSAANSGKYKLFTLNHRYAGAVLPEVVTADVSQELIGGNRGAIGHMLANALTDVFAKKQQSILLLNRRGYNTFALCMDCKTPVTCPHCSISLTYHRVNGLLMCHYCGYSTPLIKCSSCGSDRVRLSGFGTQRIEEELSGLLPESRVVRLDADTTMTRRAFDTKLSEFAAGKFDILLGTQMVAKGLDFENVTLVGVISADSALYDSDFRAGERAFSLLTQVVGRSGRGAHPGKAIIQTLYPENPIIQMAAKQDYYSFYENEIQLRRLMTYPPYCTVFSLVFTASEREAALLAAKSFLNAIIEANGHSNINMMVLGPAPLRVIKVSDKYRYGLTLKCRNSRIIRDMLSRLICEFKKNKMHRQITLSIDME